MNTSHTVRPRWLGLVLAVLGAALLRLGIRHGERHDAPSPARDATDRVGARRLDPRRTTAEGHESRVPARMIDDPEVRQRSRELDRRRRALEQASHDAPRGPLAPLGASVLVLVAVFLLFAQWEIYPLGRTSQDNALRSLGVGVVSGLAGLRILVGRPARHRVAALLALLAGGALLFSAFVFPHEIHATRIDEGVSGVLVVLAATVALVSPSSRV